jgi:predicted DsbA family dithiol-disulfide isomerase
MATLSIDVFSDIVCPWCFVGIERLENVLASESRLVAVSHHPFQLDPATPAEGYDVQQNLRRKYGANPLDLFATVEAAAKSSGIQLDLQKQPNAYPTVAAQTLVRHALAKGTQRALLRSLFRAYFLEAKNIGSASVLVETAAPHGFDEDEVTALVHDPAELAITRGEADEAAAGGVRGVPLFIFGGRQVLSGAQPESVIRAMVRDAVADER